MRDGGNQRGGPPASIRGRVERMWLKAFGARMNWEPSRADHSIDRATVSITLQDPIDLNTLDELVVVTRKVAFAHNLMDRIDAPEPITIAAGEQQVVALGPNRAMSRRVVFRRLDAEGLAVDEIAIASTHIAVGTLRYRRWADLFGLTTELANTLNATFPLLDRVKIVRLEYVDRFVSAIGGGDHFDVISRTSPYLTAVAGTKEAALHVHSGWFDFETKALRRLTNVNIDVTDIAIPPPTEPRRKITILTMCQHEALAGSVDAPLSRLDAIHDYLKSVLSEIITTEAAARIALMG